MKDSFDYTLQAPIKYHSKGDELEGHVVTLSAPSMRNNNERVKIQQAVIKAARDSARYMKELGADSSPDDDQDSQDSDLDGATVVMMLFSSGIDMVSLYDEFKKLLLSKDICLVEGEVQLTQSLFNKIRPEDVDRMLGEYIANFLMSSLQ